MRTFSLRTALLLLPLAVSGAPDWRNADPAYEWAFPRDHWARPGFKTEWWYFTGHLRAEADPSRRYAYQFTVFRIGIVPTTPAFDSDWASANLLMGHAAVTDLETGKHLFSEVLYREMPLLAGFGPYPDSLLAWARAPTGTDGRWTLRFNGKAFDFSMVDDTRRFAFSLSTEPTKPLVFQGPNGFSRKGRNEGAASMYYSFSHLATAGRLTMDGASATVTGDSWMDKEFGSSYLADDQIGWDWFSLQLDDGREFMLYVLRDREGHVDFRHATEIAPSGSPRYLDETEWAIRATDAWTSATTDTKYPSSWTLHLPREGWEVDITPSTPNQENVSQLVAGLYYWEGSVRVRGKDGTQIGRGFVELTGYGEGRRPAL